MKKTSTIPSLRSPNLLNIQEKRPPSFHIPFSNVTSVQRTPKSTYRKEFFSTTKYSLSPRPTKSYTSPMKTKIFHSLSSIYDFYQIEPITPKSITNSNDLSLYFSHPLNDSFISSLLVVFLLSHFDFFSSFLTLFNEYGEINLEKAKLEIETLILDSLANDLSQFIIHLQSLSISIIGPMEFDSLLNLEVVMQAEFEKNHTEEILISNKLLTIPPNTIKVKSLFVEKVTGEEYLVEYKLIWAICQKDDRYFPVLLRDDFTCDVLYRCTYSYLFGSIESLYYSGAKILYVCYSLRHFSYPSIRLCNVST